MKEIYLLTASFPQDEKFGLISQLRRASVSISSNIGEGCGQGTDKALSHYLAVALGSTTEIETQLFLALDLQFITQSEFESTRNSVIEVRKLILGFKKYLKAT